MKTAPATPPSAPPASAPLAFTTWGPSELATHLGVSRSTLYEKLPALEAAGLPPPLPGTNRRQPLAVIAWEMRLAGFELSPVDMLEASGLSADPTKLLAARAEALLRS